MAAAAALEVVLNRWNQEQAKKARSGMRPTHMSPALVAVVHIRKTKTQKVWQLQPPGQAQPALGSNVRRWGHQALDITTMTNAVHPQDSVTEQMPPFSKLQVLSAPSPFRQSR